MFEGLFQPTHLLVIFFMATLMLVPAVFFLLTLQRALARCSLETRATSPESVWLMLIPIFNLVYQFILVGNVARSLRNEFVRRGIPLADPEPGKSLGVAMSVLNVGSAIPLVGVVLMVPSLICWILYWVRIADYSGMIAMPALSAPSPRPIV